MVSSVWLVRLILHLYSAVRYQLVFVNNQPQNIYEPKAISALLNPTVSVEVAKVCALSPKLVRQLQHPEMTEELLSTRQRSDSKSQQGD